MGVSRHTSPLTFALRPVLPTMEEMSPPAWIRYWYAGLVLGPMLIVYGLTTGDSQLRGIGVVVLLSAVGLIKYWRTKAKLDA